MPISVEPVHVSIADAARILGTSPFGCLEMADAGDIETVWIDGRRLVRLASLRAFAESLRERV